jgi:hypothetical protein
MTDDVTCALCGGLVASWRMMVGVSLCDGCVGAVRDYFAEHPEPGLDFSEGWRSSD